MISLTHPIPLFYYMMKFYFLVVLCFLFSLSASALVGCIGPITGRLYTRLISSPTLGNYYDYNDVTPGAYYVPPITAVCYKNAVPATGCTIRNGGLIYTGVVVDYLPINQCPVDDYIPYAVLLSGGFMFFYLKGLKFNKSILSY